MPGRWVLQTGLLLACLLAQVLAEGPPPARLPGTAAGEAAGKPKTLAINISADGRPRAGFVVLKSSKRMWRGHVPAAGRTIEHPGDAVVVTYYDVVFPRAGWKSLAGEAEAGVGDSEVALALIEAETKEVRVRVADTRGKRFQTDRLTIVYYVKGVKILARRLPTDEKGEAAIRLLADGEYQFVYPRPGRVASRKAGSVRSEVFVPREMKPATCPLTITPLESVVFTVVFVVRSGGREQPLKVPGCEFVGENTGAVYPAAGGRVHLDLADRPRSPVVATGQKLRVRLPDVISRAYDLAPGSQEFVVGKAGERTTIVLIPRTRSRLTFHVTSSRGAEVKAPVILVRPGPHGTWERATPGAVREVALGRYDIRVWAKDHCLVERSITVQHKKQRVEFRLTPGRRAQVRVVGPDGKPAERDYALLYYITKKLGPLPYLVGLDDGGKGAFRYDPGLPCVLRVGAAGYPPQVVRVDGGEAVLKVSLAKAEPTKYVLRLGEFLPRVHPSALKKVYWICQKPHRVRVARTRTLDAKGDVLLGPGVYVPILDMTTGSGQPEHSGKVLECKPVRIPDKAGTVEITPVKIRDLTELIDTK